MPSTDVSYNTSRRDAVAPRPDAAHQALVVPDRAERTDGGVETANITEEVVAALGALTDQVIDLLGRSLPGETPQLPWSVQRLRPDAPTALERAMCVNDLFHESAARLERLIDDLRPLESKCRTYQPTAGYHRWDPGDLMRSLSAESDRLARTASRLVAETPPDLSVNAREGMVLLIANLLANAVVAAGAHLADAAMTWDRVADQTPTGE